MLERLADDDALGLLLGLTALPKSTHLTSYSYRVRRSSNEQLLAGLTRQLRQLGLATGDEGFNLDFHAIRHHGTDTPLEALCPAPLAAHPRDADVLRPRPRLHRDGLCQRRPDQGRADPRIIAFADYWQNVARQVPGLLVFDSKLTTYKVLSEPTQRGSPG